MQQLCERGSGSLGLDGLSSFFVLSQLTQDTCCYALDVLDGRVQQLQTDIILENISSDYTKGLKIQYTKQYISLFKHPKMTRTVIFFF